jgi:hypothetical protein
VAKTLAYNFDTSGYYVGVSENVDSTGKDTSITSTYSGNHTLINKSNNSTQTSQVKAQIGMYNPDSGYYWLASPSAYDSGYVMYVYCTSSYVHYYYSDYDRGGVAALVSLQPEVTIELEKE